jgi:hypothetical protein
MNTPNSTANPVSDKQVRSWATEFDVTEDQVHEAIAAVGTNPSDIELHLKGSRSSSNSDKVHDAGS